MDRQLIEAEGAKKNAIIQAEARAESVKIEAEGRAKGLEIEANKSANDMLNSSLTPNVLKMNQIQAFMKLSTSPNTKTIITDGKGSVINMLDDK
jgi:prohibitin 1